MITYPDFTYKYNIDVPENIFGIFYQDATVEAATVDFGVLIPKATELLCAHYCQLWQQTSVGSEPSSTESSETGVPYKEFQLDHEGYRIKLAEIEKNPLATTKWGLEYQRLLEQITGSASGNVLSDGGTLHVVRVLGDKPNAGYLYPEEIWRGGEHWRRY